MLVKRRRSGLRLGLRGSGVGYVSNEPTFFQHGVNAATNRMDTIVFFFWWFSGVVAERGKSIFF